MSACRTLALTTLLALATSTARAEPPARAQQLTPGKLLTVGGVPGRWWPMDTALRLSNEHAELPLLDQQLRDHEALIAQLKEQLAVKDERIKEWQHAHGLTEQRAAIAEATIAQAEARASAREREADEAEARARTQAAWKHPALWFALGAIVAAGAVGAGFAAAN